MRTVFIPYPRSRSEGVLSESEVARRKSIQDRLQSVETSRIRAQRAYNRKIRKMNQELAALCDECEHVPVRDVDPHTGELECYCCVCGSTSTRNGWFPQSVWELG